MKLKIALFSLLGLLVASAAQAETKVTVSGVHLCCGGCVKAASAAVTGAGAQVTKDGNALKISGADDATVQKALDALGAAGFHGTTDSDELKIKDDSGASDGKVKRLELTGIHNCCGKCTKGIKQALAGVDGVKADTAKPKTNSLVIEGDFSAAAALKALFAAGYHAKVKK